MSECDFLPSKALHIDITSRYEIVNVGIKLLNLEMKVTIIRHTGDLVEHNRLFFHKLAYLRSDMLLLLF